LIVRRRCLAWKPEKRLRPPSTEGFPPGRRNDGRGNGSRRGAKESL
jgi:hypothetical protein